jgi:hypothetical protein
MAKENAICERFMRNINRVMKNSKVDKANWREELEVNIALLLVIALA